MCRAESMADYGEVVCVCVGRKRVLFHPASGISNVLILKHHDDIA